MNEMVPIALGTVTVPKAMVQYLWDSLWACLPGLCLLAATADSECEEGLLELLSSGSGCDTFCRRDNCIISFIIII